MNKPMMKANLRMWSDHVSFKQNLDGISEKIEVIYDAGDRIVTGKGIVSTALAKQNYISTVDDDIEDEFSACIWIERKIDILIKTPIHQLIVSGDVQATLWLAIFEPSNLIENKKLPELSDKANEANMELFLEDYTDLSIGGNPRKYHLGKK
ncbi:hypothetical protein [Agrobacterium larrymoorei]|uniref:Uncharacterized protein n=1 Tax=Agrobacterium larrymoorei TaxID=160699 RepID=A0AAF0HG21_9HYPH|nr:hypothetical protein [Agrobacterium larrymoorei]WHA44061.1 hypothetical protein CFBP5477_021840 [Agrobacterium larrymoorei]